MKVKIKVFLILCCLFLPLNLLANDAAEAKKAVIDESYENRDTVGKISIKKVEASVEVKFCSGQKCGKMLVAKYTLELVKIKRKWLINDLMFDDGERLSKALKRKSN